VLRAGDRPVKVVPHWLWEQKAAVPDGPVGPGSLWVAEGGEPKHVLSCDWGWAGLLAALIPS
jgi:hypothetical protein